MAVFRLKTHIFFQISATSAPTLNFFRPPSATEVCNRHPPLAGFKSFLNDSKLLSAKSKFIFDNFHMSAIFVQKWLSSEKVSQRETFFKLSLFNLKYLWSHSESNPGQNILTILMTIFEKFGSFLIIFSKNFYTQFLFEKAFRFRNLF